jgi:hypothetical protein
MENTKDGSEMTAHTKEMSYLVDGHDRIIDVGPGWDEFAAANDGDGAYAAEVLNRPLSDFITGPDVQTVIKALLRRARTLKRPLTFPFRCDAPDRMRHMTVTMTPTSSDLVGVRTTILREEFREPAPVLNRRAERSDDVVRICAWCNRINVDGTWREIDEVVDQLGLFNHGLVPSLSHGICDDCFHALDDEA